MISVCMIVKNEVDVLSKCISSVREKMSSIVTEYVVVDTGSTDGTRELAKKLNCKVYDFEWCDDFSAARNYSISKAKNDWIFVIDADEYIKESVNEAEIREVCTRDLSQFVYTVNIESVNEQGRIQDSAIVGRLFKRSKYKYRNVIHEQLTTIDTKEIKTINSGITLNHTGYVDEVIKNKNKIENYKNLMSKHLENNPNDIYMWAQLGTLYMASEDYDKAMEYLSKVVFDENEVNKEYYATMVNSYVKCLIILKKYEAAAFFEKVWEYCKRDDKYVFYMGDVYLKTNQYEKALDAYLHIVNKEKTTIDKRLAYYMLGDIFLYFNELEQALKCFKICDDLYDSKEKVVRIEEKINESK